VNFFYIGARLQALINRSAFAFGLMLSGVHGLVALAQVPLIVGEASVIDGDTLAVGPLRVRLHGIDAPESGQVCPSKHGGEWDCGEVATRRLSDLTDGRIVSCEALDLDIYGRIIAVCYQGDFDLNALLVREGLAWAYTRYSDDYAGEEQRARDDSIGVWQADTLPAWDYRALGWERAAAASPRDGCPIKGNINRDGDRIYHTPLSAMYNRVQIDEEEGERWFCDEAEAQTAGWRAPRR
jgi:endonuclease YncB( thermonuclease family)